MGHGASRSSAWAGHRDRFAPRHTDRSRGSVSSAEVVVDVPSPGRPRVSFPPPTTPPIPAAQWGAPENPPARVPLPRGRVALSVVAAVSVIALVVAIGILAWSLSPQHFPAVHSPSPAQTP